MHHPEEKSATNKYKSQNVASHPYLGVQLDSKLCWKNISNFWSKVLIGS